MIIANKKSNSNTKLMSYKWKSLHIMIRTHFGDSM